MKDSTGAVTTDSSHAKSFTWRVSIATVRSLAVKTHTFIVAYSTPGGSFTGVTVQEHSPLISGTFTL